LMKYFSSIGQLPLCAWTGESSLSLGQALCEQDKHRPGRHACYRAILIKSAT